MEFHELETKLGQYFNGRPGIKMTLWKRMKLSLKSKELERAAGSAEDDIECQRNCR